MNIPASQRVVINDVVPNPTSGPEWIELFNDSELVIVHKVYIPVLMKGSDDLPQSVGAAKASVPATNMAGWQLGNEDSIWYTLPTELPPMPYGARIKIYFDGMGPANNDYDFSDNLAVLHTPPGLSNIFPDTDGQAALYASSVHNDETFRSRQAWLVAADD